MKNLPKDPPPSRLVATDLKQPFPLSTLMAGGRRQGTVPMCASVMVAATELAWALGGEQHVQTSGAAQPNCLALIQLLIDPINSNESGFLQSDLLPLPIMCISQSMKS